METDPKSKQELIDLAEVAGAFIFEEGFSRPNWPLIRSEINKAELIDANAGWDEAVRQWVTRLRFELGGDYQISESRRFFLLAPLDSKKRTEILDFSENTLAQIRGRLQNATWNPKNGKHVILLFTEEDDYYQYISYFYHEGTYARNGGCLIQKDYVHIAVPYDPLHLRRTLAHELTHNCLVHLRLPTWLNEGLAVSFERMVASDSRPLLADDLHERNLAFWKEQNIQEFWAGVSWQKPGDSNELSYSLAEIVLHLLSECSGDWGAFVIQADWRDAGQTAAVQCLNADLGKIMGTFLGPGDWRPKRKWMVALWEIEEKRVKGGSE